MRRLNLPAISNLEAIMFCPSCGVESNEQRRYCKHCGAGLNAPAMPSEPKKFPTAMVMFFLLVMAFITVIGLTVPLAAASDLIRDGFGPPGATIIFLASALTAFGVDGLLVWLLLRLIKIHQRADEPLADRFVKKGAMRDYTPAQIAAPPESAGSVTEHTTRNFDDYENIMRARRLNRDPQ
jgi:hypothetical protein